MAHNSSNMRVSPASFEILARKYVNSQYIGVWQDRALGDRVFRSFFKLSTVGVARLWQRLEEICDGCVYNEGTSTQLAFPACRPEHLLLVLHMLNSYCSVAVAAKFFGVSEKTHRRYFWAMVSFLNHLAKCTVSLGTKCEQIIV